MKIRIYSDLHLEFGRWDPMFDKAGDEELVVLAGDIDVGVAGINWAAQRFPHVPVVYVLGNHEYYDFDFRELVESCKGMAAGTNVHVLEREHLDVGGIRVLGTTLWTDYEAFGKEYADRAMQWAQTKMADFDVIEDSGRRLLPQTTRAACIESAEWLDQQIATADRPVLVVTHHAPTMATVSSFYQGSISNPSFHSRLDRLLRRPVRMWVHGHTHQQGDQLVNGVRVVSNQWGYPNDAVAGFRQDGLFIIDT